MRAALKRKPLVTVNRSAQFAQQTDEPRRALSRLVSKIPLHEKYRPTNNQAPQNWVRSYDASGRVVQEGLASSDGVALFHWNYSYNARGTRVIANLFDSNHSLIERNFYDDRENLVRKVRFAADGSNEKIEYEYDSDSKFLGSVLYVKDGSGLRLPSLQL